MSEDGKGNLWIGTHGDGIVRLNAHVRDYRDRKAEDNERDGTEFSRLGAEELGAEFAKVLDIDPSPAGEIVWLLLEKADGRPVLARYDGKEWGTLVLPEGRKALRLAEAKPGIVYVGTDRGLREVLWSSREARIVPGPEHGIRELARSPDGRVFAASWWALYEKVSAD
jgi:hypothetical protein